MSAKTEILELLDKLKAAVENLGVTETCCETEAPATPEVTTPAETPPAAS